MEFKRIMVKTQKCIVKIEIELNNSSLSFQEIADRLEYIIKNSYDRTTSNFIVMLLRESRSSTLALNKFEVINKEQNAPSI